MNARPNPWDAYQTSLRGQGFFARALLAVSLVAALVLASAVYFAWLSREHLREVLMQNASSALAATCHATGELIDVDLVFSLDEASIVGGDADAYRHTAANIDGLRSSVGAERIYVVKRVGGRYVSLWDTRDAGFAAFAPVELGATQRDAASGMLVMDVQPPGGTASGLDEGALPLFFHGEVVALVCVEFSNSYANQAYGTALGNVNLLVGSLAACMATLLIASVVLVWQNRLNQQQLFDMANKDVVTGLPNRRYLFTYLLARVEQAVPPLGDTPLAAFFIDIDNFKAVNDGSGHDVGDLLLGVIGGFLSETLSRVAEHTRRECLTVRLGGDEFVQLLSEADLEEAESYACMLLEDFGRHPELQEYIERYQISLSAGIAAYPEHTTDSNDLVKYADIAMYHAKAEGKHTYKVYAPSMGDYVEGITLSVREARK